jgi:hypothetical protein
MATADEMLAEAAKVKSWAASKKISLETIDEVISLGFDHMEALECLALADLKKTAIPVGRQKLLIKAIASLNSTPIDNGGSGSEGAENNIQPPPAPQPPNVCAEGGDPLANVLLQNLSAQQASVLQMPQVTQSGSQVGAPVVPPAPITGMASWADPQVYLKSLASAKPTCYNIVDFVDVGSSPAERIVSAGDDIEIVCRSGAKKPKLETLTLAQWSMANIAILYKLVQEGQLSNEHVFDYLSYTSHVLSLTCSHELVSVFMYDRDYRKLQSQHKFRWGTAVSHLNIGHLRLKQTPGMSSTFTAKGINFNPNSNKGDRNQSRYNFASHTNTGKVICKKFNIRAGCSFKDCRFAHVCNQPGCGQTHSGSQHNELKNV